MNQVVSNTVAKGTPDILVIDNRGLSVRTLQYNHTAADAALDELIACSRYDDRGYLIGQIDPCLFSAQQQDASVPDNFCYQDSLGGKVLRNESADVGVTVTLFDI